MSCFGGVDQQIYLVELLIEKVNLTPEKFKDVAYASNESDCLIVVKIKFLDFPTFEISQCDFNFAKPASGTREIDGSLDFSAGRTCLFVKQPRDLVTQMQSTPLKIGIFCYGDTYPIAETEIPLSGCLCNQIAMASNDSDHLPPPYILKDAYYLTDPGKNPSGTINFEFRLSCFGKSVTTHYQLDQETFFFKNDREDGQYYVRRVLPLDFRADDAEKDTLHPNVLFDNELGQVPVDPMKKSEEEIDGKGKKTKKDGKEKKKDKKKK